MQCRSCYLSPSHSFSLLYNLEAGFKLMMIQPLGGSEANQYFFHVKMAFTAYLFTLRNEINIDRPSQIKYCKNTAT